MVELLLYMFLLSMMLVVISDIFISGLQLKADSESTSNLEQDAKYIIKRLNYDMNRSSSVTTPTTVGTSQSSLTIVIGGENYTYSTSSSNFVLTNNSGTNNLNSGLTTVSGMNFQRLANPSGKDIIKLQFTLTSQVATKAGNRTKTVVTSIGRR